MARIAEAAGLQVSLVALLDPRSLRPISIDLGDIYTRVGLTESLALISQTADEGARYAGHLEEVMRLDVSERDAAIERLFSPAALASLMHVHRTSRWYAELLMTDSDEQSQLAARVLLLQAREEWHYEPSAGESAAAGVVRDFQKAIFQASDDVLQRVSTFSNAGTMSRSDVSGGHFEMLREPGVVTIALQLCHALVEAGKTSEDR
jgi:thioesterase domain-containing protein